MEQERPRMRVDDAFDVARTAWPALGIDRDTFARHIAARRSDKPPRHVADLYLACAASHQIPAALRSVDQILTGGVARAISRACGSPSLVDEVLQDLRATLLMASGGAPPKIASYAGDARLSTWLVSCALRLAHRAQRGAPAPLADSEDEPLARLTPELEAARDQYRTDIEVAIREAVVALSTRQRAMLRLHFVEGLRLEAIAAIYGVGRSTAGRWIADARSEVVEATRRRVQDRFGITSPELESVLRLVRSQLDLGLSSVLRTR